MTQDETNNVVFPRYSLQILIIHENGKKERYFSFLSYSLGYNNNIYSCKSKRVLQISNI